MAESGANSGAQSPVGYDDLMDSLVRGREKRSTAGRNMFALLDAEADDDLALLFEEVDEDNEFSTTVEDDLDEDMRMDSSSEEDDDQDPSSKEAGDEGEEEIKQQARVERRKRRARDDLRLKAIRKRVKIESAAVLSAPPPRPKKKSERISWLPTPEEGPTRSSSRRQTMQNKVLTHARLKDSEERRVRLIATMEEAARRKAHLKPKERTQADWLAEAARVERVNSRSLNRWEETEKRKADERRAKIEALQGRRVEGPTISFWSGIATWTDGHLVRIGRAEVKQKSKQEKGEPPKGKGRKTEKGGDVVQTEKLVAAAPGASPSQFSLLPRVSMEPQCITPSDPEQASKPIQGDLEESQVAIVSNNKGNSLTGSHLVDGRESQAAPVSVAVEGPLAALAGQSAPASDAALEAAQETRISEQSEEPAVESTEDIVKDSVSMQCPGSSENVTVMILAEPPSSTVRTSTQQGPSASAEIASSEPGMLEGPSETSEAPSGPTAASAQDTQLGNYLAIQKRDTITPAQQELKPSSNPDERAHTSDTIMQPQPLAPPISPITEKTSRNAIILGDFDNEAAQSREYSVYFSAKKAPRLTKISSSLCVITSLPSRYRDTTTYLPYANSYAYREIYRTAAHQYLWSTMLGCYVGPVGVAAQGVPQRFLDPDADNIDRPKAEAGGEPTSGTGIATSTDGTKNAATGDVIAAGQPG